MLLQRINLPHAEAQRRRELELKIRKSNPMNANQDTTNKATGKPMNRVDGRLKVTGAARYAIEFPQENIAHAVIIQSAIARGRITNIDNYAKSWRKAETNTVEFADYPSRS